MTWLDILLALFQAAALAAFPLVIWWLYRALLQALEDLARLDSHLADSLPVIEGLLHRISAHTDLNAPKNATRGPQP